MPARASRGRPGPQLARLVECAQRTDHDRVAVAQDRGRPARAGAAAARHCSRADVIVGPGLDAVAAPTSTTSPLVERIRAARAPGREPARPWSLADGTRPARVARIHRCPSSIRCCVADRRPASWSISIRHGFEALLSSSAASPTVAVGWSRRDSRRSPRRPIPRRDQHDTVDAAPPELVDQALLDRRLAGALRQQRRQAAVVGLAPAGSRTGRCRPGARRTARSRRGPTASGRGRRSRAGRRSP